MNGAGGSYIINEKGERVLVFRTQEQSPTKEIENKEKPAYTNSRKTKITAGDQHAEAIKK